MAAPLFEGSQSAVERARAGPQVAAALGRGLLMRTSERRGGRAFLAAVIAAAACAKSRAPVVEAFGAAPDPGLPASTDGGPDAADAGIDQAPDAGADPGSDAGAAQVPDAGGASPGDSPDAGTPPPAKPNGCLVPAPAA